MKKLFIFILLTIILGATAMGYWINGNNAINAKDSSQKLFVIEKGSSIREIGNKLKREGLIRDPVVFFIYIKINNQDRNIQAGDYRLSPSMSLKTIVDELNHGTLDRWVTLPEGIRAEEMADIFKENLPTFDNSWRAKLNENEGYLFPDTYLIPKDADVAMVISIMKNNFEKKIQGLGLKAADPRLARIITIASLIEREARLAEDMPLVSSVINNRLGLGMKLDIDATIQYALGYQEDEKRWWKKALTREDLRFNTPYNTYLNAGLPPSPISNPGLAAIKAAMNPIDTDYLYYVSDGKGKIHPAKTLQEHNANIKKYISS